jgi:hypothetical protein
MTFAKLFNSVGPLIFSLLEEDDSVILEKILKENLGLSFRPKNVITKKLKLGSITINKSELINMLNLKELVIHHQHYSMHTDVMPIEVRRKVTKIRLTAFCDINKIDLRPFPSLKHLICEHTCSKTFTLDCPTLEILECKHSGSTKFNLNCPKLRELHCSKSDFEELPKNCRNLEIIDCRDCNIENLYIWDNKHDIEVFNKELYVDFPNLLHFKHDCGFEGYNEHKRNNKDSTFVFINHISTML